MVLHGLNFVYCARAGEHHFGIFLPLNCAGVDSGALPDEVQALADNFSAVGKVVFQH